ncbi:flagellar hook-length control protein FliK [Thiocystis violascens]|nr:flagellar hook-length control protein FliK [Thiocystis violascens]
MIETLVGGLTTTKDLVDPKRLSSAIAQSGIWLEALVAQTTAHPADSNNRSLDLKAQLLRLAEQIRLADRSTLPVARPAPLQSLASESAPPTALPPKPAEPVGNPARPPISPNLPSSPATPQERIAPERPLTPSARSLDLFVAREASNPARVGDRSLDLQAQLPRLADRSTLPAARPAQSQVRAPGTAPPPSPNLPSRSTTPQERIAPKRRYTAMTQSGIWLEALMAQTNAHPACARDRSLDLKAQLQRLAEQLRTVDQSPSPSSSGPMPQTRTVVVPAETSPNALPPVPTKPNSADHSERPPDPASPKARSVAPEPPPASPRLHDETPHSRTTAPEILAKEVDAMIKHVVTQQLRSLEAGTDQPQWILELPFKTPSGLTALEADIRRENRGDQSEDDVWSMRIRLNLPRLGPLSINLSLRSDRLNAGLQAENATGADILREHLETLRQQLLDRKIEVVSLHASHRPGGGTQPARRPPMVSERA